MFLLLLVILGAGWVSPYVAERFWPESVWQDPLSWAPQPDDQTALDQQRQALVEGDNYRAFSWYQDVDPEVLTPNERRAVLRAGFLAGIPFQLQSETSEQALPLQVAFLDYLRTEIRPDSSARRIVAALRNASWHLMTEPVLQRAVTHGMPDDADWRTRLWHVFATVRDTVALVPDPQALPGDSAEMRHWTLPMDTFRRGRGSWQEVYVLYAEALRLALPAELNATVLLVFLPTADHYGDASRPGRGDALVAVVLPDPDDPTRVCHVAFDPWAGVPLLDETGALLDVSAWLNGDATLHPALAERLSYASWPRETWEVDANIYMSPLLLLRPLAELFHDQLNFIHVSAAQWAQWYGGIRFPEFPYATLGRWTLPPETSPEAALALAEEAGLPTDARGALAVLRVMGGCVQLPRHPLERQNQRVRDKAYIWERGAEALLEYETGVADSPNRTEMVLTFQTMFNPPGVALLGPSQMQEAALMAGEFRQRIAMSLQSRFGAGLMALLTGDAHQASLSFSEYLQTIAHYPAQGTPFQSPTAWRYLARFYLQRLAEDAAQASSDAFDPLQPTEPLGVAAQVPQLLRSPTRLAR